MPNFIGALVIYICFSGLDKIYRPLVELIKIIRCIPKVCPFKAEPFYIVHYRFYVLCLFLCRISIVKTKVAFPAKLLRKSKVKADGFGVPYVQVAVGLRRKACYYAFNHPIFKIFRYYLFKKIKTP